MFSGLVPQVGVKGVFTVEEPFTISSEVEYHVAATRTFEELLAQKFDVMNNVYLPVGLTKNDYDRDVFNNAVIIYLVSGSSKSIYIPSTYITGYPDVDAVPYSNILLSAELGPLADAYDLEPVKQIVVEALTSKLGITANVQFARISTVGVISRAQHEAMMAARQGLITDSDTDYAKRLEAEARAQVLYDENQALKQLLIDNGILGEQDASGNTEPT